MVRLASFDSLTEPRIIKRNQFHHESGYRSAMERLGSLMASMKTETLEGVAVSIAGRVTNNSLVRSPNLHNWENQPIAHALEVVSGSPTRLINDAEAAAWGESRYGHIDASFWLIIWGTGLGGALVHGDRTVEYQGSPGHSIQLSDDTECPCGKRGCWETYVGGAAIRRRYGKPAGELSSLEWDEVCRHMAEGLSLLLKKATMPTVVFGGGIALNHQDKLASIHRFLGKRMDAPPRFTTAALGDDAGLFGALAALRPS